MNKISQLLKLKFFNIFILIVIYILSILYILIDYNEKKESHGELLGAGIEREFKAALSSYEMISKEFYERVVNRPEVYLSLRNAVMNPLHESESRLTLFSLTHAKYQQSHETFSQFHFFKPDGTTFLRVHNPKKFGDNVSPERPLVQQALRTESYVSGYEEGRAGGGFRYLFPLFDHDIFLGLAEIGVSAQTALEQLEKIHEGTYEIIFNKKYHEKLMTPETRRQYRIWVLSSDHLEKRQEENPFIEQMRNKLRSMDLNFKQRVPFTLFFSFDNSTYSAIFLPILGNGTEPSGWIIRYEKDPFLANERIHLFQLLIGVTLLFLGFGIFTEYQLRQKKEVLHANSLLEQYIKAIDAGSIISKGSLDGTITYVNEQLCKTTGYRPEELIGKPHNIFRHPQTPKETFRTMWNTIQSKEIFRGLVRNLKKDGSPFYAKMTVIPIIYDGQITEYIAFRDDVTELIQQQEEMERMFSTDALTNLGNRFKLINDLKEQDKPALALVNIDRFREINDFYGNKIGDFVIIELSNRLFDKVYSKKMKLFRTHADEFAILTDLNHLSQADFYQAIVTIIHNVKQSPFLYESNEIHVTLSCGLSYGFQDLVHADLALKTAKRKRANIVVFDEQLKTGEEYRDNLLWTGKVRKALEEDRIIPYFQPLYNHANQTIDKYECLMRLIDEEGAIISPYSFLDISKKSKLYINLTQSIIRKSFAYFSDKNFEFSINLTVEDIMDSNLRIFLDNELERFGSYSKVIFELVESEGIECLEEVSTFIRSMKSKGCRIAIDDFGTGYSNFDYLIKLQADFIKIDGSLIKQIAHDSNSYNVVETIVQFAKKQNIKTIAEFVSDELIAQKVIELDIDYSQGYYYGAPKSETI